MPKLDDSAIKRACLIRQSRLQHTRVRIYLDPGDPLLKALSKRGTHATHILHEQFAAMRNRSQLHETVYLDVFKDRGAFKNYSKFNRPNGTKKDATEINFRIHYNFAEDVWLACHRREMSLREGTETILRVLLLDGMSFLHEQPD